MRTWKIIRVLCDSRDVTPFDSTVVTASTREAAVARALRMAKPRIRRGAREFSVTVKRIG